MESLTDLGIATLEWVQPKGIARDFSLRTDEAEYARLTFRSSLGTLATAETADGTWTLKRVGFLNTRITIRQAGSEEDVAVYQPKFWGDGVLTAGSRVYAWKPISFWRTAWAFSDAEGAEVLRLSRGTEEWRLRDIFKTQATLEVVDPARGGAELPLLACLAMYLYILHQQDAAVAGTAAAAST